MEILNTTSSEDEIDKKHPEKTANAFKIFQSSRELPETSNTFLVD